MKEIFQAAVEYWNNIQVGHRGRYSIERLLSFRDYYRRTSPARVGFVCLVSVVPAFAVATLMECIPLKPPQDGWKANYTFWIRLYVSSIPIAFGAVFQVKDVIQRGVISNIGVIVTAIGSCTCYVALTIWIAALWKFPIPFGYVLTVAPFIIFYMIFFLLSIGPRVLAQSPTLRRQLLSQMLVIAAQGVLAIVYPIYSSVFNQMSGHHQALFIFVMPIIKFCIKQFVAKVSVHLHECVGQVVVFSVDVCNVLYLVVCMQTATSQVTTALLIGSDAFFIVAALRSIYYHSDVSQARQFLLDSQPTLLISTNYLDGLVALFEHVFIGSEIPSVDIRVRAPFPLPLSRESDRLIEEYARDRTPVEVRSVGTTNHHVHIHPKLEASEFVKPGIVPNILDLNRVAPDNYPMQLSSLGPRVVHTPTCKIRELNNCALGNITGFTIPKIPGVKVHQDVKAQEVEDSLQALFHSEYVVMGEYIECVVPMLYSVYLGILFHLPSAAYYPNTRNLTPDRFARNEVNIVAYALLEATSFAAVVFLLKRKFGFSPLYQLAFVLETHVASLQGHLFLWISVFLQLTLVHNGRFGIYVGIDGLLIIVFVTVVGVNLDAPFK
ncbi:hypothetical protein ON010_g17125 [Phytophthora cinnamomi]|nr:hypothetical protein ON010_g17125 [Phytophthora cinnamomi]